MKLYTASQLAKALGCRSQTITRNATVHGIGTKHGTSWVFEYRDIKKMRRILDENYKRDWARMGRAGMAKRWHNEYEPGMFDTKGYEDKIPPYILENLIAWGKKQHRVGDFLTAVLSNNLFEAYKRADEESAAAMRDIIKFVYNRLPNSCWGSPQAVRDWTASEGFGKV